MQCTFGKRFTFIRKRYVMEHTFRTLWNENQMGDSPGFIFVSHTNLHTHSHTHASVDMNLYACSVSFLFSFSRLCFVSRGFMCLADCMYQLYERGNIEIVNIFLSYAKTTSDHHTMSTHFYTIWYFHLKWYESQCGINQFIHFSYIQVLPAIRECN